MTPNRASKAAVAALIALCLVGPGTALAATPSVKVGSTSAVMEAFPEGCFDATPPPGAALDCTGASPTTVSIGDTAQFTTTLKNVDNSTISQLYLKALSDASVFSYGTPVTFEASLTMNGVAVSGACDASATLSCFVRNVKPQDIVQVTVVYLVPATNPGTSDPYTGDPSCELGFSQGFNALPDPTAYPTDIAPGTIDSAVCVQFVWSTTGATPNDGGTSHGDVWNWYDGAVIRSDADFAGRYVVLSGQQIIANNQGIGPSNKQSTKAFSPALGIPVTVEDGPDASPASCNSALLNCTTDLFGEWSLVNVNNGDPIPGVTLYHFAIQLDSSEIPSGINANNLHIYHFWDGGGDGNEEIISAKCSIVKSTGLPSNAPCRTVTKLPGGDLLVDLWSLHNGGFKPGLR